MLIEHLVADEGAGLVGLDIRHLLTEAGEFADDGGYCCLYACPTHNRSDGRVGDGRIMLGPSEEIRMGQNGLALRALCARYSHIDESPLEAPCA
ncbi:hypothetical protein MAE02_41270 [Microvirga aerophila]|uniref:Uncharacterized protein n=1 Tax=Microvirga aerophila TaxID=670291 RepID=A0A512BWU9_9HYPH|nr:hypothetical protein MAE02_41270 [Microvirga aerophila]